MGAYWLISFTAGNKQWDKTILLNGNSDAASAFQTKDGCFLIGNWNGAEVGYYKSQPAWDSSADYWIVKFCDTIISSVTDLTPNVNITIYPNPFSTDIAIALRHPAVRSLKPSLRVADSGRHTYQRSANLNH